MRSKRVIAGDERQKDFDRLAAGWRAEYEPEGQAAESLMERVILNDWLLQRAERNYLEAAWKLAEALAEDGEQLEARHAKVQLYLRYRTTAERSFYRAYYALRGLRKDKVREELDVERFRGEIKRAVQQEATIAVAERERKKAETEVLAVQQAEAVAVAQREKALQQKRKKHGGAPVVIDQWV